jgi:hypothetical protein
MRHICVTTIAVVSIKYYLFSVCVCSLGYPAFKAHVLYYSVTCGLLYYIFLHYVIKCTIFRMKVIECNIGMDFLCNFCLKFLIIRWIPVRYHKCTQVFMKSTHYSYHIVIKLQFPQHFIEKYSNIKFHENPFSGSRVIPWRQKDRCADRQTDTMKLKVTFRNFANAPKNDIPSEIRYYVTEHD